MRSIACLLLALSISVACAQTPAEKSEADIQAEDAQAQTLYQQQNFIGALPLYEDLHKQRPQSLVYTERLGMAVLVSASGKPEPEARAIRARAKSLLLEAKAGGDNSNLLQILLEKIAEIESGQPAAPRPAGQEWVDKGEAAFRNGKLDEALDDYRKALEVNPSNYSAALFAGDVEYKRGNAAAAGGWFAKAIAIDPNVETAYRYWGDCLDKAGDHKEAEQKFIGGIVAAPYTRAPRVGLKQWADANHAKVVPPPITLPGRAVPNDKGQTSINIDPSTLSDPAAGVWLVYSIAPTVWQKGAFAKAYPNEKAYRHSLGEESQALHMVVTTLKDKHLSDKQLTPTLRSLLELDKDGMIDCWILLDNPDQGIAQDYAAYRKDHRDLLAQYIAKYDVHPM